MSPKRRDASANLSTMRWRADSVCSMRAQSSANRASRMIFSIVFVLALRRRRSNRDPSNRYFRNTPSSMSLTAWLRTQVKNRLKSTGARTHHCFTPLEMSKGAGSKAGRSIDGLDGAQEHLRGPSDGVQLDLTCLLFPPLVLHASERGLGLALEVLEVVFLRNGRQVVLPGREGLLLLCQEFGDSLVVLIEPVLVDPLLRTKQGLAANSSRYSKFLSFSLLKAALVCLGFFCWLGKMCRVSMDQTRRWSVQHSAPRMALVILSP